MSRPALNGGAGNLALQAALADLDEYHRAVRVRERAAALHAQVSAQEIPLGLSDLIHQTIDAGTVPDDFAVVAARSNRDRAELQEQESAVRALADNARLREEGALEAGLDQALGHLDGQLADLLDEARALAPQLDGATTAQQAIAAGSKGVKAWQKITELAPRYSAIRHAQVLLMDKFAPDMARRARPSFSSTATGSDAVLANLDEVWPGWRDKQPERLDFFARSTVGPWPEGDDVELFVWLVTSAAQPWVPTRRQLQALWDERVEADRQMPQDENGPLPLDPRPEPKEPINVGDWGRVTARGY